MIRKRLANPPGRLVSTELLIKRLQPVPWDHIEVATHYLILQHIVRLMAIGPPIRIVATIPEPSLVPGFIDERLCSITQLSVVGDRNRVMKCFGKFRSLSK